MELATRTGMLTVVDPLALALIVLMALTTVFWTVMLVVVVVKLRRMPRLVRSAAARFPSDAPLVSILVPARNEAARILEHAVISMANQDYPCVEVVVVDDRSSDETFAIAETIAHSHDRVRVIRGAPLPEGWAGKPWALEQAKRAALGDWLLATDADIEFEPETLRAAMTIVFQRRLDAISLLPDVGAGGFWSRAILPVAAWMIGAVYPIDKTNDSGSDIALGCGAFILMRRSAHDAVGGYGAIKDELIDDLQTARALKRGGFAYRIESAQELLYTPMYGSLVELWSGFTKNAFAGAEHRVELAVRNALANLALTLTPVIVGAFACTAWLGQGNVTYEPVAFAAATAYLAMTLAFAPVYAAFGRPHYAFLCGPANWLMVAVLLNSTMKAVTGRQVDWRGQAVTVRRSNTL